jgi:hypothetical protein
VLQHHRQDLDLHDRRRVVLHLALVRELELRVVHRDRGVEVLVLEPRQVLADGRLQVGLEPPLRRRVQLLLRGLHRRVVRGLLGAGQGPVRGRTAGAAVVTGKVDHVDRGRDEHGDGRDGEEGPEPSRRGVLGLGGHNRNLTSVRGARMNTAAHAKAVVEATTSRVD